MYQKDFILRLVEQFGKLIADIMRLIKKGEYPKAAELLEHCYYDFLKEDAAWFRDLPDDQLTDKLMENHNYTNDHLEILAGLFNAEAELDLAQGKKTDCLQYSKKALIIFEFVDKNSKLYSEARLKMIEEIKSRINNLNQE